MSVLDPFDVVLLDLNRTFMFDPDRFGEAEDFGETYRRIGGNGLPGDRVAAVVRSCFERTFERYRDPSFEDDFPQVAEVLAEVPETEGLGEGELALLERVFAVHELGHVPPAYAEAVRRLASRHSLGLVSNIWSKKGPWLAELERAGIEGCFDVLVFSSDGRSMKPSSRLYEEALAAFSASRERVVMVGDSLRCDVGGGRAAGIRTVWIAPPDAPDPPPEQAPDHRVTDLLELTGR